MRKGTFLICCLLTAALLSGCSKKTYRPTIQHQNRISTEERNRLLAEAELGHAVSQFKLGNIYSNGEGVPINYSEAMKWYKKAALQGHAGAQFNLGLMYDKGHIGIPKNNENAYIWYKLSSEQGMEDAKRNFTSVEALMTTSEIERAESEATKLRVNISKE